MTSKQLSSLQVVTFEIFIHTELLFNCRVLALVSFSRTIIISSFVFISELTVQIHMIILSTSLVK
jgi:hypothetical protein